MRTMSASVFLVIAIMIVPVSCSALEIPTQEGSPFSFFTWPFQLIVTVAQAPMELASGGIKTINTLFLPPGRQLKFGAAKQAAPKPATPAPEKVVAINPAKPITINMPAAAPAAKASAQPTQKPVAAAAKPEAGAKAGPVPPSAKTESPAGS